MKILIITSPNCNGVDNFERFTTTGGGENSYALQLAKRFLELGNSVDFICKSNSILANHDNLNLIPMEEGRKGLELILPSIDPNGYDLIINNSCRPTDCKHVANKFSEVSSRVLTISHFSIESFAMIQTYQGAYSNLGDKFRIVTVSRNNQRELDKIGVKSIVATLGVNPPNNLGLDSVKEPSSPYQLVLSARIAEDKGSATLALLKHMHPDLDVRMNAVRVSNKPKDTEISIGSMKFQGETKGEALEKALVGCGVPIEFGKSTWDIQTEMFEKGGINLILCKEAWSLVTTEMLAVGVPTFSLHEQGTGVIEQINLGDKIYENEDFVVTELGGYCKYKYRKTTKAYLNTLVEMLDYARDNGLFSTVESRKKIIETYKNYLTLDKHIDKLVNLSKEAKIDGKI